jgi:hypothetical protein
LPVTISCGVRKAEIRLALKNIFRGCPEVFSTWMRTSIEADLLAFERAALLTDLEEIETFAACEREGIARSNQLALL